jgi:organic hydroperoxide reductase OsmC/OhrA
VDRYVDDAVGIMSKNAAGKLAMTRVTLRPDVGWSGSARPTHEEIAAMHHEAHDECFIANSVTTEVLCEPVTRDP